MQPDVPEFVNVEDRSTYPRESLPREGSGLDHLLRVLRVLRRRLPLLLILCAVTLGTSIAIIANLPKSYSATSVVGLDLHKIQPVPGTAIVSDLPIDVNIIEAEVQTLQSTRLAHRVMASLRLESEFALKARRGAMLVRAWDDVGSLLAQTWNDLVNWSSLGKASSAGLAQSGAMHKRRRSGSAGAVDAFLRQLTVRAVPRTYTLTITFTDVSPERAALVANTLAREYLSDQLEAKTETARRASAWLSEQLAVLRERTQLSERAIEEYTRAAELTGGQDESVQVQQLTGINTQLVLAQNERAIAEAQIARMEEMVKKGESESLPEVLSSPLIQRLREEESDLRREERDLLSRYGERHPTILKVRNEISDLREMILAEIGKIIQAARSQVNEARSRERSLLAALRNAQGAVGNQLEAVSRLGELQREAEVNRNLVESFMTRFVETVVQTEAQQADARVLSSARVPFTPSFPKARVLIPLFVVASAVLSIGMVLLVEAFDRKIRSSQDVEATTGLACIGMVPEIDQPRSGDFPRAYLHQNRTSSYAESVQRIVTMLLSLKHGSPRLVVVTSALPDEGKTTLAISLSMMSACSGLRVVLVDCDNRRLRATRLLGATSDYGLIDYLAGAASLSQIATVLPEEKLDFVSGGGHSCGQPEELSLVSISPRLRGLLQELCVKYDLVVVDTPPVLALSESANLARMADATLVAARWGTTTPESVQRAVSELRRAGAQVLATVITRVNLKRHYGYGYRDVGYYSHVVAKYYNYHTPRGFEAKPVGRT